jgi:hypothetical protein
MASTLHEVVLYGFLQPNAAGYMHVSGALRMGPDGALVANNQLLWLGLSHPAQLAVPGWMHSQDGMG